MANRLEAHCWRVKQISKQNRIHVLDHSGHEIPTTVVVSNNKYPGAMFFSAMDEQLLDSLSSRLSGLQSEKQFVVKDKRQFIYGAVAAARFSTPLHLCNGVPPLSVKAAQHDIGSFLHLKHYDSSLNSLYMVANTMANTLHCVTLHNFGESLSPTLSAVFLPIETTPRL